MNHWSEYNGRLWPDDSGVHINAHGGSILREGGLFYWYGEHKIAGTAGNRAWVGVHVYTSPDLKKWTDAGIAFDIREDKQDGLKPGCVIERPKVLRNPQGKFVMFFHLELDENYSNAWQGIAIADRPEGPFALIRKGRPNPGVWPENTPPELREQERIDAARRQDAELGNSCNPITPQLSVLGMDLEQGQQSRDLTLFADDDGKAYVIYSSEKNSTTHIAELDGNYTGYTGRYWRIFPWRWMEAPVVFKRGGRYYLIASGCTGWAPNPARSAVADFLTGPWTELGNPAVDEGGETTYGSQGACAVKLPDGEIIFIADQWRPENAIDGRYLFLPLEWQKERPVLRKP